MLAQTFAVRQLLVLISFTPKISSIVFFEWLEKRRFYPGIGLFYNVIQAIFYLSSSRVNKARIDVSSNFRGQTTFGFDFVCPKRSIWKFLLLLKTRAVENDFQFAL